MWRRLLRRGVQQASSSSTPPNTEASQAVKTVTANSSRFGRRFVIGSLIVGGGITLGAVAKAYEKEAEEEIGVIRKKSRWLNLLFGSKPSDEKPSSEYGFETPTLISSDKYGQLLYDRFTHSFFHRIYYLIHIGQRLNEIISIFSPLAVYAFVHFFVLKPFYRLLYTRIKFENGQEMLEKAERDLDEKFYSFVVQSLKDGGTCFIKFSQWLSTRADLLDPQVCKHFATLHSNAPKHHMKNVKQLINEQYRKREHTDKDIIVWMDSEHPLASGAIGQVYKGKMRYHNDQTDMDEIRDVAIKVRHPHVETQILQDLKILELLCVITSRFLPSLGWLQLQENVKEFTKCMKLQTNFRFEGENLKAFQKNFQDFKNTIIFPTPYYYSPNILIESFEPGISIQHYMDQARNDREVSLPNPTQQPNKDMDELVKEKGNKPIPPEVEQLDAKEQQRLLQKKHRHRVAELGTDLFLKMMLHDNLLHADLHPGNLLVRINKETNEPMLVVLDAGMVTQLSHEDRQNFVDLFSAIIRGEGYYAAQLMIERSRKLRENSGYTLTPENAEKFKTEMADLITFVLDKPIEEIQVGKVMETVLSLGRQYHVPIESTFSTLVISTIVVEGIARQLNPRFQFAVSARPFLARDKTLRMAYIQSRLGKIKEAAENLIK
ncbi:hypothetical protein FDP41_003587 [Naegleria fowleri]|uniref:Protein kinase domain-containing protein n=1 Tax=Naegleria fowleri TaxID=5763 RepID=A0A6A5BW88_NAEFO|nr:uncharacterized protein FDP41_003587 [Naegleria fowleri]KAF0977595.1 hypothetical protein FDP41_003587 [Naegleria fowleri]CAG4715680.1 unnamed protein product [Naegleria fowleri]